jgi:hypothetical protein
MKCKECREDFNFWDSTTHVSIRVDWPRNGNNPKHVDLCMKCYPIHKHKYERKEQP